MSDAGRWPNADPSASSLEQRLVADEIEDVEHPVPVAVGARIHRLEQALEGDEVEDIEDAVTVDVRGASTEM